MSMSIYTIDRIRAEEVNGSEKDREGEGAKMKKEKKPINTRKRHHLVIYRWWEQEDHVVMIYEQTTRFLSHLILPSIMIKWKKTMEMSRSVSMRKEDNREDSGVIRTVLWSVWTSVFTCPVRGLDLPTGLHHSTLHTVQCHRWTSILCEERRWIFSNQFWQVAIP